MALQTVIDKVHKDDILMLIGDFNARVRSSDRHKDDPMWGKVRGYHGVGKMNESGEELWSYCAANEFAIMNTWFEKKHIHKYTWQHPGNKMWHCTDYVIMK